VLLVLPSGGGDDDDDDGAAIVPPKLDVLPGVSTEQVGRARAAGAEAWLQAATGARAIAGRRLVSRCDRESQARAAAARGKPAASLPPPGSGGGLAPRVPGRPRPCYVVAA
jgi:hypothetical protein